MNREDIIRMAREVGFDDFEQDVMLERFAALVSAAERERIFAANAPVIEQVNTHIKALVELVAAEREACAKVCETQLSKLEHTDKPYNNGVRACAAAIRARGEE
jgi:hypothetical protein